MCQFSSCPPYDESSHELFQQLSPKAAEAIQGGYWAYHLDHAGPYNSGGHAYSSPPKVSPVEESISTYGYSYGYGTDF